MNVRSSVDGYLHVDGCFDVELAPHGVRMPVQREILATAEVFGLLSDPGRLRLLVILGAGEANVGTLSALSGLSESATSHALRLLRAHEVVQVRRTGRLAFYRLADSHVGDLLSTALAHAQHSEVSSSEISHSELSSSASGHRSPVPSELAVDRA